MKGGADMGSGSRYTAETVTLRPRQAERMGMQRAQYLEKYQIVDIVNGIKVIRTRFRLRKRRRKK